MGGAHLFEQMTRAVLAVLSGVAPRDAAADHGVEETDLADAVDTYREAGRSALHAQTALRDWYQIHVEFTDWDTADLSIAHHLYPYLERAHTSGVIARWWYLRKAPCWRLRLQPGPGATVADVAAHITGLLDRLTHVGVAQRWRRTIYEPELFTFGGELATDIAHDLFHADSRAIMLRRAAPTGSPRPAHALGDRELSVVLCSTLARAAGQDWHDQGDMWHRVTALRPLPDHVPADRVAAMTDAMLRLTTTTSTGHLFNGSGPLAYAAPWAEAFSDAGRRLADTARDGRLDRGLRHVLATHVIHHWNRLGLPSRTQAILARAARDAILLPDR